jgi:hypothetical protein
MPERDRSHRFNPDQPNQLPPELATFLRQQPYAALLHATDLGTVLVVKAPGQEIQSVRGRVPIEVRHELYRHPAAPVVRMVTRIYDQPHSSLGLETFVNVDDEQQRADYGELARQDELPLLFYDESLQHRLAKRVRNSARTGILEVLITALRLRAQILPDRFDFDAAKAEVIRQTNL